MFCYLIYPFIQKRIEKNISSKKFLILGLLYIIPLILMILAIGKSTFILFHYFFEKNQILKTLNYNSAKKKKQKN